MSPSVLDLLAVLVPLALATLILVVELVSRDY